MKVLFKKLIFKYIHRHWNIALANFNDSFDLHNIRWMRHNYTDRWFADPFLFDESSDTVVVLAEEYMRDERKARIAKLTINKINGVLENNETILDIATHLSFPNFMKFDDKIYIYPENGRSGNTKYYEYTSSLVEKGELSPLPLADAVIEQIDDRYYMFFTLGKDCNGNKLIIYSSYKPFGPYEPYQEVSFNENIARRAGKMLRIGEMIISPAQVCNNAYGEAVSIQKMKFIDGKFKFEEVKRIYPQGNEYPNGLHTFNTYGNIAVIDGYRYDYPIISKFYFKLRGKNQDGI